MRVIVRMVPPSCSDETVDFLDQCADPEMHRTAVREMLAEESRRSLNGIGRRSDYCEDAVVAVAHLLERRWARCGRSVFMTMRHAQVIWSRLSARWQ